MSSYKCPKCDIAHLMYQPTIEQIHADMFAEPEWESEKFEIQPGDVPFEDGTDDY